MPGMHGSDLVDRAAIRRPAQYCALVWRTGDLPRWTAVLAAIGAAAHTVLLASFVVEDGFFSLQGHRDPAALLACVLGTAIAMVAGDQGAVPE